MKWIVCVLLFWTTIYAVERKEWDALPPPYQKFIIEDMASVYQNNYPTCKNWDIVGIKTKKHALFFFDCTYEVMGRTNGENI